jgi:hypothetical protein
MDTWNLEQLYSEIWEEPVFKIATRYGISDVMLGKVCRQLSIPVPRRGYWARKAAGPEAEWAPLPGLKQIPVLYRFKVPEQNVAKDQTSAPEPTDVPAGLQHLKAIPCPSRGTSPDGPADEYVS